MKNIIGRIPVEKLIRVACYLAIVSLLVMIWSVLDAAALPVVLGMSVGQGLGVIAFLCFLLAVLGDTRNAAAGTSAAQDAEGKSVPKQD